MGGNIWEEECQVVGQEVLEIVRAETDSTKGLEQEWCCLGGEEALARQDKPSPAQTAVSQLNCLLISRL